MPNSPRRPQGKLFLFAMSLFVALGISVYLRWDSWVQMVRDGWNSPQVRAQGPLRPWASIRSSFDMSQLTVSKEEIHSGGPDKDGIPALTQPKMVAAAEADYLQDGDRVVGVAFESVVRAYPLKILNYHEIVNDSAGDLRFAVSYCPLCDSVFVFNRKTKATVQEFGVSGLLYNSNVLMYERTGKNEPLWSQLKGQGISGGASGVNLQGLPFELTSWSDWKSRHPQTQVLSIKTGHNRDYNRDPYQGYFDEPRLMFPVQPVSDRLPAKEKVFGVWVGNTYRAYPLSELSKTDQPIEQQLAGKKFSLIYHPQANSVRVVGSDSQDGVQWMYSLWFAWYAFHPETEVFKASE